MKKLGFGCMRLPITDQNNQTSVDFKQFCDMVDSFIEQGFTYFDTAYMYHDFKSEEFAKMLEVFNLETIYGLEYSAQIYKMNKYREYTFEEFITELNERNQNAEKIYKKMRKENLFQKSRKIKAFFDNGLGICLVKDLYMDRPAAKVSNYFLNFVKDYKLAAQSLIELKNFMK